MKWIGERISFVDEKQKTTVVIYPENVGWIKALMGAWVAMWYSIGATVIWSVFVLHLTDQERVILYVFLSFWAYYAYRVTRSFLWLLWGKELLKIDEVSLTIKRSIRGYGKATAYFLENIHKMRMYQPKPRSLQSAWEASPWISGGERLEFDYQGKIVRFGRKLNEKDSELLFRFLIKRIETQIRQNAKRVRETAE